MKTLMDRVNEILYDIKQLTTNKLITVDKTHDGTVLNKMRFLIDCMNDSMLGVSTIRTNMVHRSMIQDDGEISYHFSPVSDKQNFNYPIEFWKILIEKLKANISKFYITDQNYFVTIKDVEVTKLDEKIEQYIENIIQEISKLLDAESEINRLTDTINQGVNQKNAIKKELNEVVQQKEQLNTYIANLESYNLAERINQLDAKQKADLLSSVWLDSGVNDIKNIIIKQGFDANHCSTNYGANLWEIAFLQGSDINLFKLLVNNGLNFTQIINDKSLLQIILDKNDNSFTNYMLDNINKDSIDVLLLDLLCKDDAVNISKIFKHNHELVNNKFHGCSLLQLAIKTHSYETQKLLLDFSSDLTNDKGDINITPMSIALKLSDLKAISILEPYDAKFLEKNKLELYDKIIIDVFSAIVDLNTDGINIEEALHKIISKEEVKLISIQHLFYFC